MLLKLKNNFLLEKEIFDSMIIKKGRLIIVVNLDQYDAPRSRPINKALRPFRVKYTARSKKNMEVMWAMYHAEPTLAVYQ